MRRFIRKIPIIGEILNTLIRVVFMRGPSYRWNKKTQESIEAQKAIGVGLIMSNQRDFFVNSYEVGFVSRKKEEEILVEWWGITDSESAKDKLDWLKTIGHRSSYKYVGEAIQSYIVNNNIDLAIHKSHFTEEETREIFEIAIKLCSKDFSEEKINIFLSSENYFEAQRKASDFTKIEYEILNNMRSQILTICDPSKEEDVLELFTVNKLNNKILFGLKDFDKNILAWDAGRLSVVARICADLGYISREECQSYLKYMYNEVSKLYSTWEEFGKCYILGRLVWGGRNFTLNPIAKIIRNALNPKWNSPWIKKPLR